MGALGEKTAVIVQTVSHWTLPNGVPCAPYHVQPASFLLRKRIEEKAEKFNSSV